MLKRVPFQSPDTASTSGSRVFIGTPDYRVFIWGIDVTQDVFSVNVSSQIDENMSTAYINLVNDQEKWIVPTYSGFLDDLQLLPDTLTGVNDLGDLSAATVETNSAYFYGKTAERSPRYFAAEKIRRFFKSHRFSLSGISEATIEQFRSTTTNGRIFPLNPGLPMFQANDPVRVFLKDPWNFGAQDRTGGLSDGKERWYLAFTGYIASVTEDFEAETCRSLLRINCEEIRRLMRYMRTTTNAQYVDLVNLDTEAASDGTPQEFRQAVANSAIFSRVVEGNAALEANRTLLEAAEVLIFGNTELNAESAMTTVTGIFGYKNKRYLTDIEQANVEQVMSAELNEMYPELTIADVENTYGPEYDFDNLTLRFYTPSRSGFTGDVYPYDFKFTVDFNSEYRSRFDILCEFIKLLDGVWYTTGRGDIVIEFPQYDTLPTKYDDPWNSVMTIQGDFKKFSTTHDDRDVQTVTVMQVQPIVGITTAGPVPFTVGVHMNYQLMSQYGFRMQREQRPFPFSQSNATKEVAAMLAAMRQGLANSNMIRIEGLECLPNFRAPIARPYYFKYRNIMAFATGVQHFVTWGALCQTVYQLMYVRPFDTQSMTWQKLTGNYGWNWVNSKIGPTVDVTPSLSPTTVGGVDTVDYARRMMLESPDKFTTNEKDQIYRLSELIANPATTAEDRTAANNKLGRILTVASSRG